MRELTTFALGADAELARATLEAAGIAARVSDFSAMQEMADYRLVVDEARMEEAALLLGLPVPDRPASPPSWTGWATLAAGIAVVAGILVAILT